MAMDDSMAIFDAEIIVLDFETTGSVSGFPVEPWQIGMVSLKQGKVDPSTLFESLIRVDPNRPFNPHAPGRHALLREAIAQAPSVDELWNQQKHKITGVPLCAHNIATEKKCMRILAPMHRFGIWIDTLRIARKVWPGCSSYALEELIITLGLKSVVDQFCPCREAHDALYDAVASAVLLQHLLEQPGWNGTTVQELASI